MLSLMTNEVLWIEEPLIAGGASVWSLLRAEVDLKVAVELALAVKGFVTALDSAKISVPPRWVPYDLCLAITRQVYVVYVRLHSGRLDCSLIHVHELNGAVDQRLTQVVHVL